MTIDFKCSTCNKPLHAPDETAGMMGKCEQCGTILAIPERADYLWPPGVIPSRPAPPTSRPANIAEARPLPRPAPAPLAVPASQSGITQNGAPAPIAMPVAVETLPAQSTAVQTSAPRPIPLAAPRAPLVEDFDSLFDPDDLNPESALAGTAYRLPGNAAGIRIGNVIESTWRIYQKNIGLCAGTFIVLALAIAAVGAGALIAQFLLSIAMVSDDESALIASAGVGLVLFSILVWLQMGFLTFLLNLARGETAGISDLFSAGFVWLQALAVSALQASLIAAGYFATVLLGLPILYVAGVLVALLIEPAKLALIEQERGIVEAVQYAVRLTLNNILPLAALFPIAVLGMAAACAVTFGVGAPFFAPLFMLILPVTYLRMTGQRTADRRSASG